METYITTQKNKNTANNKLKFGEYIETLTDVIKGEILGTDIIKEMGLEKHLCDLDLAKMFLGSIIGLSYRNPLIQNTIFHDRFKILPNSKVISDIIEKWRKKEELSGDDLPITTTEDEDNEKKTIRGMVA